MRQNIDALDLTGSILSGSGTPSIFSRVPSNKALVLVYKSQLFFFFLFLKEISIHQIVAEYSCLSRKRLLLLGAYTLLVEITLYDYNYDYLTLPPHQKMHCYY